ncbi:hypothetical protein V8C34DRAFT_286908 [Trichoderma compactum]
MIRILHHRASIRAAPSAALFLLCFPCSQTQHSTNTTHFASSCNPYLPPSLTYIREPARPDSSASANRQANTNATSQAFVHLQRIFMYKHLHMCMHVRALGQESAQQQTVDTAKPDLGHHRPVHRKRHLERPEGRARYRDQQA